MELIISKNANINYLAKIVDIQTFTPHPDPETTKLKCTHIDGYNIIVGIDSEPGIYIYFPTSCEINSNLLSYANLYRHKERNRDENKSGFFEDNGRVKAIKLRGVISEGFLLEWNIFHNFLVDNILQTIEPQLNTEFDSIKCGDKTFWICKKYIIKTETPHTSKESRYQKRVKKFNRVIDTQFRFHYETAQIKKIPNAIKPDDLISCTSKWHGSSGISAYVLCKKPVKWYKFWKKYTIDYDYLYSSRSVIKNANYNKNQNGGYYSCDVWKYADDYIKPFLIKGMSAYYEIVGFLPNGSYIQKNYDYGCIPPKSENDYKPEINFKVRVYRITLTNVDGQVHEFSAREVQQWCKNNGLIPVTEFYYGYAKDLYKDLDISEHWYENFLEKLSNDKNFYMEMDSPDCNNKVPHEGIVIKKENMISAAFKLKCFRFLQGESAELDAGESNIEDNN